MRGKDLGALVGQIGMDISQWERGARGMEGDLERLEGAGRRMANNIQKNLDQVGRRMERVGGQMSKFVTAPLVGLAGLAVREFGKFDDAMIKSTAIMGDLSDAVQRDMSNVAREIGRTTAMSAEQAAESYFFLASAGLDAAQSIAALPQVAQFAQAGMFDMATATDLVTDAQSALGLVSSDATENLENMTKVMDVLVKANTLANASVEQFAESLTNEAAATLKSFNKDVEEGVAVLAAFADQGIKGQVAGTGLSRVIRLMTQAANNNKEELNELGLEIFDADGKMRSIADIIENLEVALNGMSDEMRTSSLESIGFTARVQGMILPLLGTSGAIREYEKQLRSAGGITKEVADRQMQSFNKQVGLLWDNVKDLAISFGQTLVPALKDVIEWAQRVTQNFQDMEHETRVQIISIAALLAASGPLLMALGKAARIIAGFALLVQSKFILIAGAFVLGVGIGQWFVDNWEELMEKATKATQDFFTFKMPDIKFGGVIGEEVQKSIDSLNGFFGAGDPVKAELDEISEKAMTTFDELSQRAKDTDIEFGFVIEQDSGSLQETVFRLVEIGDTADDSVMKISELEAQLEGMGSNMELAFTGVEDGAEGAQFMLVDMAETTDKSERSFTKFSESWKTGMGSILGIIGELTGATDTYKTFMSLFDEPLNQATTNVEGFVREIQESLPQAEIAIQRFAQVNVKSLEEIRKGWKTEALAIADVTDELAARINTAIVDMVETFAAGIAGVAFAGGGFEAIARGLLGVVADLAIQMGRIILAAGIGIESLKTSLAGFTGLPAIAAGAALIAIGSVAKAGLASAGANAGGGVSGQGFQPSAQDSPSQTIDGRVEFIIDYDKLRGVLNTGDQRRNRIG